MSEGYDIYRNLASKIFKVPVKDVTPEQRRSARTACPYYVQFANAHDIQIDCDELSDKPLMIVP